jgi:hypothetical protein
MKIQSERQSGNVRAHHVPKRLEPLVLGPSRSNQSRKDIFGIFLDRTAKDWSGLQSRVRARSWILLGAPTLSRSRNGEALATRKLTAYGPKDFEPSQSPYIIYRDRETPPVIAIPKIVNFRPEKRADFSNT